MNLHMIIYIHFETMINSFKSFKKEQNFLIFMKVRLHSNQHTDLIQVLIHMILQRKNVFLRGVTESYFGKMIKIQICLVMKVGKAISQITNLFQHIFEHPVFNSIKEKCENKEKDCFKNKSINNDLLLKRVLNTIVRIFLKKQVRRNTEVRL